MEYTPARVPAFVIVTEPVTESPIFIVEAVKMAPKPERVMERYPEAKALDAIAVGVAVKLAKVPPTAATAITEVAARVQEDLRQWEVLEHFACRSFRVDDTLSIGPPRIGDRGNAGMNWVGVAPGESCAFARDWVPRFAPNVRPRGLAGGRGRISSSPAAKPGFAWSYPPALGPGLDESPPASSSRRRTPRRST